MSINRISKRLFLVFNMMVSSAFAAEFKLDAGNAPLYQSVLSKEVYQQSRADGLQDITITNGAGEQVPYALLDHMDMNKHTINKQDITPLKLYPIKEKNLNNPEALHIQLEKNASNTTLNISSNKAIRGDDKIVYLIDLGEKHPPLTMLMAEWQGANSSFFELDIYASKDLKNWESAGTAVFLKTIDETPLIQNNITLDYATQARYLKIEVNENAPLSFTLEKINGVYNAVEEIDYALYYQELTLLQRVQDDKTGLINVDFESLGRIPATEMRVHMPQANAITKFTIFSHNKADAPWRSHMTSTFDPSEDTSNPNTKDIPLLASPARYWRLQFNQANGGLGKENPKVELGWYPQTLVWNARGAGPFTLHVGGKAGIVNRMDVQDLIADYKPEKARKLPKANMSLTTDGAINVSAPAANNAWVTTPDYKTWLLWAGLALGVLLLAGMAYSLLKKDHQEK